MNQNDQRAEDKERKPSAYIGSAVAAAIMIWVVNAVPGWNLRFVTSEYPALLWAFNLSLGVQLAGNLFLLIFHPRFFHHLMQAGFAAVSLLALVVAVTVYPFDFSMLAGSAGDLAARIVLFVAIGGTAIGLVVHVIRMIGSFVGVTR